MLTTDTALQVGTCCATLEDSLADKLTYAIAIQNLERIVLQYVALQVDRQELGNIVAREAESHLRKVVSTEREELCNLGNLISRNSGARNLNHRTYQVVDAVVALGEYSLGRLVDLANISQGPWTLSDTGDVVFSR